MIQPALALISHSPILTFFLREYSLLSESQNYSRAVAAATDGIDLDVSLVEAHRSLAFAEVWGIGISFR
jgi:hypothetical protein